MTTMIAKEFGLPLEEVASWSWRKRELYANALAAYGEHEQEMMDEVREQGYGTAAAGAGDHHPAVAKHENVADVQNPVSPETREQSGS